VWCTEPVVQIYEAGGNVASEGLRPGRTWARRVGTAKAATLERGDCGETGEASAFILYAKVLTLQVCANVRRAVSKNNFARSLAVAEKPDGFAIGEE